MRPPDFWDHGGLLPALLSPIGAVYAAATAARVAGPGWRAPVPVICVGNASVGGTGKTPVALDIGARLMAGGHRPHFLTRGYHGTASCVTRVDPQRHSAADVGDEALLLANIAPCWVGADRAATARAAIGAGATVVVMDDGLQNPGLAKTLSFLVVDGARGFGNGRVLPAGPLREPVAAAAARVQAAILIGPDCANAASALPASLPILRAGIVPAPDIEALRGRTVLPFAGIGRPEKFFAMLVQAGLILTDPQSFADHHAFTPAELARLAARARAVGAIPVCTPKDFVRIPPSERALFQPIGMSLHWAESDLLDTLLGRALA